MDKKNGDGGSGDKYKGGGGGSTGGGGPDPSLLDAASLFGKLNFNHSSIGYTTVTRRGVRFHCGEIRSFFAIRRWIHSIFTTISYKRMFFIALCGEISLSQEYSSLSEDNENWWMIVLFSSILESWPSISGSRVESSIWFAIRGSSSRSWFVTKFLGQCERSVFNGASAAPTTATPSEYNGCGCIPSS